MVEHAEERIDADVQTAAEIGAPLVAFEAQEERLQSPGVEACLCELRRRPRSARIWAGAMMFLLETEARWDLVVVVVRFQEPQRRALSKGLPVLLHGCR